jgi:hypothetical protein
MSTNIIYAHQCEGCVTFKFVVWDIMKLYANISPQIPLYSHIDLSIA